MKPLTSGRNPKTLSAFSWLLSGRMTGFDAKRSLTILATFLLLSFLSRGEVLAQSLTITSANTIKNGITDGALILGQKDIAVFGFGVKVQGALTINEFNIGLASPDSRNNYFSNYRLFRSADSVFSADDLLLSCSVSFRKNNLNALNISGLSENFDATAQSAYYFLLADYTSTTGIVPGNVQFNFSPQQRDAAVISGRTGYNSFNVTGKNFALTNAEIKIRGINSAGNGISSALIAFGQKDIVLFGFGIQVRGVSTISQINIASTNNIGSYFSNGRLYRSADNLYSSDDILLSSIGINKSTSDLLSITNLSESFDWSPEQFYFVVADYTVNGPVNNQTIGLKFSPLQTSPAIEQSSPARTTYNNFDIPGQTFTFARTAHWLGNAATDPANWNNPSNWSGAFVPGPTDLANIGIQSFVTQPIISTSTNVGTIVFGSAQPATLSIDSGAVVNAVDIIQSGGNTDISNTIRGKGSLLANSLQINDNKAATSYTSAITTKIISGVASLSLNSIILRSKWNTNTNNAALEVSGRLQLRDSIQIINENPSNSSSVHAGAGSILDLAGPKPFGLSAAGTNSITSNGVIRYSGIQEQLVNPAISYFNLELAGSGTKTIEVPATGVFSVAGNLSVKSPAVPGYAAGLSGLNIRGDIAGDAPLNAANISLNVGGNWLNSATDTLTTTVTYDGQSSQIAAPLSYQNVVFSNGGTKTLSGPASVKGTLEVRPGTILNTGDMLTLLADSANYASIKPLLSGADIQGKVTVQSFIRGGKRGYLTLSSPVYDTTGQAFTYKQLKNFMPVTGNRGPLNGWDEGAVLNPYGSTIRLYNEHASPSQSPYLYPVTIRDTIGVGKGFFFFFRGDRSNIYYKLNPPVLTPENVLMDYAGYLNKGTIKVPISYTNYSDLSDDGFNVVGNPYASTVDLDQLLAGTQFTKVWILTFSGTYAVYDLVLQTGTNGATRYIAPGQGFYVQAKSRDVLLFTENCKVSPATAARIMSEPKAQRASVLATASKTQPYQYIKLQTSGGAQHLSDEAIIVFNDGSSSKSNTEDAVQIPDAKSLINSLSADAVPLASNYFPNPSSDLEIKLQVDSEESGQYSLNISENKTLDFADILIKDNFLQTTKSILSSGYTYTIDKSNPATFGVARLSLIFRKNISSGSAQILSSDLTNENIGPIQAYPNPVSDYLKIKPQLKNQRLECKVYDLSGRRRLQVATSVNDILNLNVSALKTGVYILEVKDPDKNSILLKRKFLKN